MSENMEKSMNDDPLNDFVTINQLITDYRAFSEGGIRALIFHEHKNGFHKCVRRIGRKILISKKGFYDWIEENNK